MPPSAGGGGGGAEACAAPGAEGGRCSCELCSSRTAGNDFVCLLLLFILLNLPPD